MSAAARMSHGAAAVAALAPLQVRTLKLHKHVHRNHSNNNKPGQVAGKTKQADFCKVKRRFRSRAKISLVLAIFRCSDFHCY